MQGNVIRAYVVRLLIAAPIVVLALAASSWLRRGGEAEAPRSGPVIIFSGYSVLEEAFTEGIFPAFRSHWRRTASGEVSFVASFGSLGRITKDLVAGSPADLAVLSAEVGIAEIFRAGVASAEGFARLPNHGVIGRTLVVIGVRPGNPLGIREFADLARPGIKVVQPDPLDSGTGVWALLAEFGAGKRSGGWNGGRELILAVADNLTGKVSSAHEARSLFANGAGDALVTLEHDVLASTAGGTLEAEIVYPTSTILCEPALLVIERNIETDERAAVGAFIEFVWSGAGQKILGDYGFRPAAVGAPAWKGPARKIEGLFRIEDLGGWQAARSEIIDGIWRTQRLRDRRN